MGVLLLDQWADIGVKVNFEAIDFNVLVDNFTAQVYDAVSIFWGFSFPFDPDGLTEVFSIDTDLPGSGFNTGSFYNARFEELIDQSRALPGCDVAERTELYQEAYEIIKNDSPWIHIGVGQVLLVAQPNVEGWAPKVTANLEALHNEESWFIAP
jgi:glutathione transport system substrate-binding protein